MVRRGTRGRAALFVPALLVASVAGCPGDDGEPGAAPTFEPTPGARQDDAAPPRREPVGPEETTTMSLPSEAEPVLVIERRGAEQVRGGEEYAYTLVVTNRSEFALNDVVIRETMRMTSHEGRHAHAEPGGAGQQVGDDRMQRQQQVGQQEVQQQQQQPNGQQQAQQQQMNGQQQQQQQQQQNGVFEGQEWHFDMLGPGESRTIEASFMPPDVGALELCTSATYRQALCTVVNVVAPDLGLQAFLVDAEGRRRDLAYACDELFLYYRVFNPGTAATPPARVTHQLPQFAQVADTRAPQVEFEVGAIPPGEVIERRIPLRFIGTGAFEGVVQAQAGDLTARAPVPTAMIVVPELAIQIDGPQQAYLGRPVTYRVTVANPSDVTALNTVVRLQVPEGFQRPQIDTRQVRQVEEGAFEVGTLPAGERRSFTVTFDPGDQPAQIRMVARAEAYCAPIVQDQIATEVIGVPAIRLLAVDLTDPVAVGDVVVYEVQVMNQGTEEDLDIRITGELPRQLRFIDGSGPTQVQGQQQRFEFASIDRLAPGQTATWRVRAEVLEPGQVQFTVRMVSQANPQPVISQEPTTLIEAAGPARQR
ncbi:MAG: hypothetical protein M9894_37900 [Planctomycetes bacterium]|nr:hypothetical protein [Planctomycetota bacterium]